MYDAVGAFTAGIATCAGPCVAPRFAAVAGLTAGKTRAQAVKLCACFAAGLLLGYASFAAAAWIFRAALQLSHVLYAGLACGFGIAALLRLFSRQCTHESFVRPITGAGAAMLLGCGLALVVSPCCAPVIVAVVAYAAADGNASHAAMLLACYAAGHALPLLALAGAAQKFAAAFTLLATARATALVTSGVLLGVAGYYAVLA